ncbi:hypothetical protein EIP86_005514 [Pleurotus ostreatoroseus]|nr:hypothetical protein EIP86_005514 [Pleurotus ostreatoroseus]
MFAQYSPLFTSGLLSDNSPSSSRSSSPKRRFRMSKSKGKKTSHDSLPVTVNSATFSVYAPHAPTRDSQESALFLTLKPSRRAHSADEDHSFLSLDLADTHRSMSLRRKDTVTSKATSFFGRSEPVSPVSPLPKPSRNVFTHAHAPSTSSAATVIPRVSTPVLRRTSRETLRLPSPKPAPSASLPDVPASPPQPQPRPREQRRPADLALTFSSCFPDLDLSFPSPPTSAPYHRPTYSAPTLMTPASASVLEDGLSYFAFESTPRTPPTPPPTSTRPDSFIMPMPMSAPAAGPSSGLRVSPSVRSSASASVATRQRNRSAALAALEGRGRRRRASSVVKRNFMSMSDDEDEENDEDAAAEALGTLDEEPLPTPASAPASSQTSRTQSRRASKRASASSETKRSRRSTIESFFAPLTNFIDLRDDKEREQRDDRSSRSWRSFVEISS